jgi:hypothetical protein
VVPSGAVNIQYLPTAADVESAAQWLRVNLSSGKCSKGYCTRWNADMRITIAGPEGERLGPYPVSLHERELAKSEQAQHFSEAMQYAKQMGGGRINDTEIPRLLASLQQDVIAVFDKSCVARCVDALARELLRCESISEADTQSFIGSRITEQQRIAVREECCLSGSP